MTEPDPSHHRASPFTTARAIWRAASPPATVEAELLARFGAAMATRPAPTRGAPTGRRWAAWFAACWARPSRGRWVGVAAGTLVALGAAGAWLVVGARPAPELTTPFLLVAEPAGRTLDVAQLVRVSVARETMLDFGIPVPPQQLQEPVRAEMLLGQRGELLAVRFVDRPPARRAFFN